MYNHYIPQSDGSFRRSSVPEANRRPVKPPSAPKPEPKPEQKPEPKPEPEAKPIQHCDPPEPERTPSGDHPLGILRRLLPKELDVSDLIIIGLLLLLSEKEEEDDLSPLLTIALYFLL